MTFLPLTGRKLFDHGYKNQLVGGKKKNGVNSLSYVQTNLERRVLCTSFVMKRLRTPNANAACTAAIQYSQFGTRY